MLKSELVKLFNFKVLDDCGCCGLLCETVICSDCYDMLKSGFDGQAAQEGYGPELALPAYPAAGACIASNDDLEQTKILNVY